MSILQSFASLIYQLIARLVFLLQRLWITNNSIPFCDKFHKYLKKMVCFFNHLSVESLYRRLDA